MGIVSCQDLQVGALAFQCAHDFFVGTFLIRNADSILHDILWKSEVEWCESLVTPHPEATLVRSLVRGCPRPTCKGG